MLAEARVDLWLWLLPIALFLAAEAYQSVPALLPTLRLAPLLFGLAPQAAIPPGPLLLLPARAVTFLSQVPC